MSSALHRIRYTRANAWLLEEQNEIRASMRVEKDAKPEARRKKGKPPSGKQLWEKIVEPSYKGQAIKSLSKDRAFWSTVKIQKLSKRQLYAVVNLLALPADGKKQELLARILDWIAYPSTEAKQKEIAKKIKKEEQIEGAGTVFTFGENMAGQLGLGHKEATQDPTPVEALKSCEIAGVFSGFDSNCCFAVTRKGEVFAWGGNGEGPLGTTTKDASVAPDVPKKHDAKPLDTATTNKQSLDSTYLYPQIIKDLRVEGITAIACGRTGGHVAALSEGGHFFTWGKNDYGQLGTGSLKCEDRPIQIMSVGDSIIVQVSVGNSHSAAVSDGGKLFTWGSCWAGQLGLGENKRAGISDKQLQACYPTPTMVPSLQRVKQVSCGAVHTAVVTVAGQLYTFGCGDGGRLGLGANTNALEPRLVSSLKDEKVLQVSCSNWHTLVIAAPRKTTHGEDTGIGWVYTFGSGLNGQLGLGGKQRIAVIPMKSKAVSAGLYHNCMLASDGRVYTWGRNNGGCLGRYTGGNDSFEPAIVEKVRVWGQGPAISVACGSNFTAVVTSKWKGISKQAYNEVDDFNLRKKVPEKINSRSTEIVGNEKVRVFDDMDDIETKQLKPTSGDKVPENNSLDPKVKSGTMQKASPQLHAADSITEREEALLLRPRRSSLARSCTGFLLDSTSPNGMFICMNCRLPKRLHDIE